MRTFIETHPIEVSVDHKNEESHIDGKRHIHVSFIADDDVCLTPAGVTRLIKMLEDAKDQYHRRFGK